MQFKVLTEEDKIKYQEDVINMMKRSDNDFVPPLSARTSTTQSDLTSKVGSEQGLLSYYSEMNKQQILGVFEEERLIAFVSYKENYSSKEVPEESLPNIYLSS